MKKNLLIYIPAVLAALAIKIFYRTADSDQLSWILAPTTWWVQILSGIPFEKAPQVGYVSHEYRFIIAPSCSGVRFLLIAFVMMIFSFTHKMDSVRNKVCWLGFSAVFAYIATIFVNGIRITISIYLPIILSEHGYESAWMTAEQLHTLIGTTVYFSLLFVIYNLAGRLCRCFLSSMETTQKNVSSHLLTPAFWYEVMVLGIPALGRWYRSDWAGFWQYAALVVGVCISIVLLVCVFRKVFQSSILCKKSFSK
ncbi:MAG: exosortase K [Lachnospiraceae bacterium]|nr:exosortase K [Lachnospiraceae bacterium]